MERVDREAQIRRKMKELKRLRKSGEISEPTYRKMMAELEAELREAKEAKRKRGREAAKAGRRGVQLPSLPGLPSRAPRRRAGWVPPTLGTVFGLLTLAITSIYRPSALGSFSGLFILPAAAGFACGVPCSLGGGGLREASYAVLGSLLTYSLLSAGALKTSAAWAGALASTLLTPEASGDPLRLSVSAFLCLLAPAFIGGYAATKAIPRRGRRSSWV